MPGDPQSTAARRAVGTAQSDTPGVIAGAIAARWAPSFFGVVPKGGVRRRPFDVVCLVAAAGFVIACAVLTDGFTSGADGINARLRGFPPGRDTLRPRPS